MSLHNNGVIYEISHVTQAIDFKHFFHAALNTISSLWKVYTSMFSEHKRVSFHSGEKKPRMWVDDGPQHRKNTSKLFFYCIVLYSITLHHSDVCARLSKVCRFHVHIFPTLNCMYFSCWSFSTNCWGIRALITGTIRIYEASVLDYVSNVCKVHFYWCGFLLHILHRKMQPML